LHFRADQTSDWILRAPAETWAATQRGVAVRARSADTRRLRTPEHAESGQSAGEDRADIKTDAGTRPQTPTRPLREAVPNIKTVRLDSARTILHELPLLRQEADFVVGDGPGSQDEISRALLSRADLAIVPCKASMLEVRALANATEALRVAQDIRNGPPAAVIVLSMVGRHYRLTQDMRDAAAALKLPMASTAMILRQIYADSPGQASVMWKMGSAGRDGRGNRRDLSGDSSRRRTSADRHGTHQEAASRRRMRGGALWNADH
jgi:hypothetical protein